MSVEFQNNVARRPSSKQSNVCHPSKVDVKTKVASKVYLGTKSLYYPRLMINEVP